MAEGSRNREEQSAPLAPIISNNITASLPSPQEAALQELWLRVFELTSTAPLQSSVSLPSQATGYTPPSTSQAKRIPPASGRPPDQQSNSAPNRNRKRSKKFDYWRLNPQELHHGIYESLRCHSADWWISYYLRANDWDVESALDDLVQHVYWRRRVAKLDSDILPRGEAGALRTARDPNASPRERKVAEGFLSVLSNYEAHILKGKDNLGRIICLVKIKNHRMGQYPTESYERYIAWHVEMSRMMMPETRGDGILLLDGEGYQWNNFDFRPMMVIQRIMSNYYPQGLGDVIIYRAPMIFMSVWQLVRRVIPEDYHSHIHWIKSPKDLRRFLPLETITRELGGTEPSSYRYEYPDLDDPINGGGGMAAQERRERERSMLQEQHMEIARLFEETTKEWIDASRKGRETKGLTTLRDKYQRDLLIMYWKLDPYIRSRTIYDRLGWVQPPDGADV